MSCGSIISASIRVRSWLLTTDHKRIGILYLFTILVFFIDRERRRRVDAHGTCSRPPGDMVTSETYNKLFTIHGTLMVWFFLIPSIPAVLGNFVLPLMIGARDVAFPKLNLLSWYLFMARRPARVLRRCIRGGVDTGWTFYTPYSSTFSNSHVIAMAAGIFIAGFWLDPHRPEFHRHDSQDARAGHDLVSACRSLFGRSMRPASSWCWRRLCSP